MLDVAYFFRDRIRHQPKHPVDDKRLQPLLDVKEQRHKILLVLVEEAIATLRYGQKCPLVGNHAFIVIGRALMFDLEMSLSGYLKTSSVNRNDHAQS